MAEPALESYAVRLADRLRSAGVAVPVVSVLAFARAIDAIGRFDRDLVYWAGRATLICRPEDAEAYDAAFAGLFGDADLVRTEVVRSEAGEGGEAGDEGLGGMRRASYSARERLLQRDFVHYSREEWDEAGRLIAALRTGFESRPSRRLRPSQRGGSIDLSRSVRKALSRDGEALLDSFLTASTKPRRLVFLLDISGSMEPYSRAFLRLAHAASSARAPGEVETFVLGTRVTRITRELAARDPDRALGEAHQSVADWYGGTRLGEGIAHFNAAFGARGLARGAVVVIVSDGWDRGDTALLGGEMGRLSRLAHRLVWVNPLRASPGYEPLAAGMAAALPHVDDFVAGHSLASLEELAVLLAGHDSLRSKGGGRLAIARS